MPDYTRRTQEMLAEDMPTLDRYREAAAQYGEARNRCLNDLLQLVADDEAGRTNAARWADLCDATGRIPGYLFEEATRILASIVAPNALTSASQIVRARDNEKDFFGGLGLVVAADARDRIIANLQELQGYTQSLDKAWEQIISQVEEAHKDEQESYQEILELVKEAARELAEDEKTWIEKSAEVGGALVGAVGKLGDFIERAFDLEEGVGKLIELAGENLKERLEAWAKMNGYLKDRMERLLRSIEEEKGGALPIFKEIRQQVYNYWNEKGAKTSRVHLEAARSSLDSWKSSLPTSGQKDDAESFSADVFKLLSNHMNRVEEVAKEFEEKWNGIFLGPLQATTQDKLTDAPRWKQDVESLVEVELADRAAEFLSELEEIYGKSYTEPFSKLQDAVKDLPDENEHKRDVLDAVAHLREKIQSQIAERIPPLKEQIDKLRQQLAPGPIQRTFEERVSEIKNLVV